MRDNRTEEQQGSNNDTSLPVALHSRVKEHLVEIHGKPVMADADVAELYGVETRRINEAVRNNADKFPRGYMFELNSEETLSLRSKISTTNVSPKNRARTKVFTEKGLYMLATILKSKTATEVTFAIIETFAKVRDLKHGLVDLHREKDKRKQTEKMHRFGELLSDLVMPDLETTETESSLELNFIIGKIKHTVKRIRRSDGTDKETDE